MTEVIDQKVEKLSKSLDETLKKVLLIEKAMDKMEMQIVAFFHAQTSMEEIKDNAREKEVNRLNEKIDGNTKKIDGIDVWKEDTDKTLSDHGAKIGIILKISLAVLIGILGTFATVWLQILGIV